METQDVVGKEFDKYARSYDQAVNQAIAFSGLDVDFFTRVKADDLLVRLARHGRSGTSGIHALDVGCGVGNYHAILAPHLATLTGVEVSADSIDVARERMPNLSYEVYDGTRLPFAQHMFDCVFTICVMHHVPPSAWTGFVAEMYRVARPGSLVAVYEHNPLNPATRYVVNSCEFDRDAVLLWPRQVRKLLSAAGFGDIRARSILTVPPLGSILGAVDRMFALLPFGAQYVVTAVKPAHQSHR